MTFTAYLVNIEAQTGKEPEHFRTEAARLGLTTHAELLKWLKQEIGLGHGHATAMIFYIRETKVAKGKLAAEARQKARARGPPRRAKR